MASITVKGMSCQHCVSTVKEVLTAIDGVTDVEVDLLAGKVTFEETQPVTKDVIKAAIDKAGFEVAE